MADDATKPSPGTNSPSQSTPSLEKLEGRRSPLRIGLRTIGTQWEVKLDRTKPPLEQLALVTLESSRLARHALVVGQSGSGKSIFLGRLIEELMLRTLARCVVIDPNGDYMRIEKMADDEDPKEGTRKDDDRVWASDPHTWGPKWYTEDTREEFEPAWGAIPLFKKSLTEGTSLHRHKGGKTHQSSTKKTFRPRFGLQDLPADLVASIVAPDGSAQLRRDIRGIHELIQAVGDDALKRKLEIDSLVARTRELLEGEGWIGGKADPPPSRAFWNSLVDKGKGDAWTMYERFIAQSTTESGPFAGGIGKIQEYDPKTEVRRLDVLDIASIPDSEARALSVGALVQYEWARSRRLWQARVDGGSQPDEPFYPTFLVIDEAHNLVPRDVASVDVGVLRELIRQVAAEGRKYGLHLILCTQRPDKLDSRTVSECQNIGVLRMVSKSVLKEACALLGIDFRAAKPCLDIPSNKGFGMLFGDWAGEGERTGIRFKGLARRTAEGGVKPLDAWMKQPAKGRPSR